jgi:hypothetical protein
MVEIDWNSLFASFFWPSQSEVGLQRPFENPQTEAL